MRDLFETLGLKYDKESRARVDAAIREALGVGPQADCPEVWAAVKGLPEEDRSELAGRVAALLG